MKKFLNTGNMFRFAAVTLASLFISLTSLKAQVIKNYTESWKKVEEFNRKRLPKSALAEVKKIFALAKKENQQAQIVKSLVYMHELQEENNEDNETLSLADIENELKTSKQPVTSLLQNLQAEIYWQYMQQNRWKFYNRTNTINFNKDDIATWTIDDLHSKISSLFLQSISQKKLLQSTSLAPYEAIIVKGKNSRHLRPTLYDLLAFRALEYFENDERYINKPSYEFQVEDAAAFAPAAVFAAHNFKTSDTISNNYRALVIMQELIRFHAGDAKPDALIDADVKRLIFMRRKSIHPEKERLYVEALENLAKKYENSPAASQPLALLASWHHEKANSYKPFGDTTYRFSNLKALEIIRKALATKVENEGWVNAFNLEKQITQSWFKFSLEKVNIPAQPFRVFVQYKNVPALYFRILKADDNLKNLLKKRNDNEYWKTLTSASSIKSWNQQLPATNDYQAHGVEIGSEGLAAGEYFLLASSTKDFSTSSLLGGRMFYVSSISYLIQNTEHFVLNRFSGEPLKDASVQIWHQVYNYKTSEYSKVKGPSIKTDGNGYFRYDKRRSSDNMNIEPYFLEITHKGEKFMIDEQIYNYYYDAYYDTLENKVQDKLFLFADRSIYRPGQQVFFKGILVETSGDKNAIITNKLVKVLLVDVNGEEVDSMMVTTNEFGSFNGKFQLPLGGLTGEFSLEVEEYNENLSFSVEEYKRPKFSVDYEQLKGTYKVNDEIKVTGIAKAYAGNNIDGAMVNYRVVRQPRFLYPWLFRWGWFPPTAPMEIAHGTVKTDKDGKFTVSFKAIPDLSIDKKYEPVFDYQVFADVTDINGETRSGQKTISAGYKSLIVNLSVPETITRDSLKNLIVMTQNMNGAHEPAKLDIHFTELLPEGRLMRARYWERPDQFVMTKEEFVSRFPNDIYANENDPEAWAKGNVVYSKSDSSKPDGKFSIDNKNIKAGVYEINVSTIDKDGNAVKVKKYLEVIEDNSKQLPVPKYLSAVAGNSIEPGETTRFKIGTSASDVYVVQAIDRNKHIPERFATNDYSVFRLNNTIAEIPFTAKESDRGGFGVSYFFVKHNRVYEFNSMVEVPWTNKQLDIEYSTYRDNTLPGSEERWKVKLKGYKNEKVAAEMLASMYDASLDQFRPHNWSTPYIWMNYSRHRDWNESSNFIDVESMQHYMSNGQMKSFEKVYDRLLTAQSGYYGVDYFYRTRSTMAEAQNAAPPISRRDSDGDGVKDEEAKMDEVVVSGLAGKSSGMNVYQTTPNFSQQPDNIQIRKNFNETAFFFPDLKTDAEGNIEFSFTIPEALTKWKFQTLAHTKNLSLGYNTADIVTQKQLMVQPNAPRFFREGDKMEFSAKIVNLTEKEFTGQAELLLFDATTNQPVDGWFHSSMPNQYFTVAAGQSDVVNFPITIPFQFNKPLTWKIVARAGNFSDGEENTMPVLTNRMLVTETMPLTVKTGTTKTFDFTKLLNSGNSETLQHYGLTVEYTSNPAWYAIQALPYLMEYPYDCSEQTWNRYYANSIATFIANSSPKIKQVFDTWKGKDTSALISNLLKNQELKSLLIEETPWVLQAKSETEQKKNIALLFDMMRMSNELNSSYEKLKQMQSENGGFVWFKGGPDDRFITQYILTGIGHLDKINGILPAHENKLQEIIAPAITYLDSKIKQDYDNLVKWKTDLNKYVPGHYEVQYLYMRSFFPEYAIAPASKKAVEYFRQRAAATWTKMSKYLQGMTSLALHRTGDKKTPNDILKSLKETSVINEELGMYWKDMQRSWFWFDAPIERHALMIEAFQEISKDNITVDALRTWLLRNKQTNNWGTTKATAEACYALLMQGTSWLTAEPIVEIKTGNTTFKSNENAIEAGTGYFKKAVEGSKVNPQMGKISVSVSNTADNKPATTWGAVYWQYFEDLDKITTAATPLSLRKKLFVEKNTDRGPVISPVNDGDYLKVGDKIKVRIELRVDRDMDYVHMKDMRASALEPVNVLSGYRYQGGLGYYESTRDASTNFFFSSLRKGTYVFEYNLFVTHTGNFSNGITTIQCMYAPEFSSHSEGIRINVDK